MSFDSLLAQVRRAIEELDRALARSGVASPVDFTIRTMRANNASSTHHVTRTAIGIAGWYPVLQSVHAQLLIDLIEDGRCELLITSGSRLCYRRVFSCNFVGDSGAMAEEKWRALVRGTGDAATMVPLIYREEEASK